MTRSALTGLTASFAVVLALLLVGCTRPAPEPGAEGSKPAAATAPKGGANAVTIKGSDTLVGLAQRWGEAFMKSNPDVNVSVTGGGTGTGIAALEQGTCDIADASRDIKPDEKAKIEKSGNKLTQVVVAWDGIGVIVNPANPVKQITLQQLADMFTGKITNWKDVGGKDAKIVLLIRETSSGTYQFFKERVLQMDGKVKDADYAASAMNSTSNQTIHDEVAGNPDSVGYVGLAFIDPKVRALAVGKDAKGPFLQPNLEDVLSKAYPIARPLYCYLAKPAEGAVKQYIDFVLGPDGQQLVKEMGFVPLPKSAPAAGPAKAGSKS